MQMVKKMIIDDADTMLRFCCQWQTERMPWKSVMQKSRSAEALALSYLSHISSGLDETGDRASLQAWMLLRKDGELWATYLVGLQHHQNKFMTFAPRPLPLLLFVD